MNFLNELFFKKYNHFARELGYNSWSEAKNNTFFIFHIPKDGGMYVTELLNKKWAVWNNEGEPPYKMIIFSTWSEAINYLRNMFNEYGYPESDWFPEGYNIGDNVFVHPPSKGKKI